MEFTSYQAKLEERGSGSTPGPHDGAPLSSAVAAKRRGRSITLVALVFYGVIFAAAWVWMALTHQSLFYASVAAESIGASPANNILAGTLAGLAAVYLSRVFTRRTRSGEALARELGSALGRLSGFQCVVLALSSGIAEEALFRGALQPQVGLFAASLLFGMAHFVPRREFAVWIGTTILAGFMLGLLFQETGNLIAPVVAHFVVNALNLRWLSAEYGRPAADPMQGTRQVGLQAKRAARQRPAIPRQTR